MDVSTVFKDAVFNAKKIKSTDRYYGLVVDIKDGQTIICRPDGTRKTDQQFEKGTWLSFRSENIKNMELFEDIQIEDPVKFPQTYVHNDEVTIMSQATWPNANYDLNPNGLEWRYLAWSTEWNVVGDPKMLFARFTNERIFPVRMIYKPGKQHAVTQTPYNWQIIEIFRRTDSISQFQIIRAPWNIGTQQFNVDEKNKNIQNGFVYQKICGPEKKMTLLYLATANNDSIKVYAFSNRINRDPKLGDWVEYNKAIVLGSSKDKAFVIKVSPGKTAGKEVTYSDKITEYLIDFNFYFDDDIREALLRTSKQYSLKFGAFQIRITTENLNTQLVKCVEFGKNINLLQPTDRVEAKARFVGSEEYGYFWTLYEVSHVITM